MDKSDAMAARVIGDHVYYRLEPMALKSSPLILEVLQNLASDTTCKDIPFTWASPIRGVPNTSVAAERAT
jgi:hypothetical protein